MDNATISAIVEASRALSLEAQGYYIATQAIQAARAADAAISRQALADEYRAWHAQQGYLWEASSASCGIAADWGRHLLSRGAAGIGRSLEQGT